MMNIPSGFLNARHLPFIYCYYLLNYRKYFYFIRKHMQYNLFFMIVYFFIAEITCIAMENKNISHDFREVTAVENPRFVQYINNKRVVIAGVHGAYIVNPIKDKVIRHLNSFDYYNRIKESNITVSKNKQRIISF